MPLWKDPKTGKYRYQFQYQRRRYSKTGFDTKRAAAKAMAAHKAALETPPSVTPQSPQTPLDSGSGTLSLETLMVEYLRVAERSLAPKTLEYRKIVFRRFLRSVGNVPVSTITPRQVEEYLLSRPTNHNFNKDRTELMRLFSWGQRSRNLPWNPIVPVDKVRVERTKKAIPSPKQMAQILMAAGEHRSLLLIIFHTMARIDEVLRLKWEDVNFQEKALRLWTRKRRGGSWEYDWLPMNEDLENILWGLWNKRQQDEWVFYNPLTRTRYVYRFKLMRSICRRAGVPQFGYHTIRHFVASYLFDKKKVSLPVISKLLRHKNMQTTERYLQCIDPKFRETMKLLEGDVQKLLSGERMTEQKSGNSLPTHHLLTDLLTGE